MASLAHQKNEAQKMVLNPGRMRRSNPSNLTKKDIERLMTFPALRKRISASIEKKKPTKIDIVGPSGKYVHFRLQSPNKFEKKSFRTTSRGTGGTKAITACPAGKFKKGRCSVGVQTQSVMVPKSKVQRVVEKFIGKPLPKRRRIAANPLLMTVDSNPKKKKSIKRRRKSKNPHGRNWPFGKRKVPMGEFMAWARKNLDRNEIRELNKSIKKYREMHHGADVDYVTAHDFQDGSKKRRRMFMASMGKSPEERYITPTTSNKDSDTIWVHPYEGNEEDMPNVLVSSDGKAIMKIMEGSGRKITDWMYG